MKTQNRRIVFGGNVLIGIAALLLVIAVCQRQKQVIRVRLAWHHQTEFAGLYVARERGYYDRENLDVTFHEGGQDAPAIPVFGRRYFVGLPAVVIKLLLINGFGATPLIELYLMVNSAKRILDSAGITATRFLTGSYVTSLDMAGVSVTLSVLDSQAKTLWDAPVHTAALRWGA